MEEDAMEEDAMEEEAVDEEDASDATDSADTTVDDERLEFYVTNSLLGVEEAIDTGQVFGRFTFDELPPNDVELGPACVERFSAEQDAVFDIVLIDDVTTSAALVYLPEDSSTAEGRALVEILDPVDCQPLG